MKRFEKTAVLVFALAALFAAPACAPEPPPVAPALRFDVGPQVVLRADEPLETVEQYTPPLKRPNVEHEFNLLPSEIAKAWARDRLQLTGSGGTARMTIIEASVVQEDLDVQKGVKGWFHDEQNRRLTARLEVRLDYVGVAGSATATASASASRTISESTTLNDLEAEYYELLSALADSFQREMDAQIQRQFAPLFTSPA